MCLFLSDANGLANPSLLENDVFEAVLVLLQHFLVVRLALGAVPRAHHCGHLVEYSIVVSQSRVAHYIVVSSQKGQIAGLFPSLPPSAPSPPSPLPLTPLLLNFESLVTPGLLPHRDLCSWAAH
jgi:hypothetical protein